MRPAPRHAPKRTNKDRALAAFIKATLTDDTPIEEVRARRDRELGR